MNSKKSVNNLYYNNISVEYTKSLFDNILSMYSKLKLKDDQIAKLTKIPLPTYKGLKKNENLTNSSKILIYRSFDVLIKAYGDRVEYNVKSLKFEFKNKREIAQFKDGTYFCYFKKHLQSTITHFILIVNGLHVTLWSKPKIATGEIKPDRNTYSIILISEQNENNYEFYIGTNNDNPNLKYFVALWRNLNNEIHSGICMAKYVGIRYRTIEEIEKVRSTILDEMELKMPKFAQKLFSEAGRQIFIYNLTEYEYEDE